MSAPIVVPFNFDPVETSIKNSNYTIPAGRYARMSIITSAQAEVHTRVTTQSSTTTNIDASFVGSSIAPFICADHRLSGGLNSGSTKTLLFNNNIPNFTGNYEVLAVTTAGSGTRTITFQVLTESVWTTISSYSIGISASLGFNFYLSFNNVGGLRYSVTGGVLNNETYILIRDSKKVTDSFYWLKEGDVIRVSGNAIYLEEYNKIS